MQACTSRTRTTSGGRAANEQRSRVVVIAASSGAAPCEAQRVEKECSTEPECGGTAVAIPSVKEEGASC